MTDLIPHPKDEQDTETLVLESARQVLDGINLRKAEPATPAVVGKDVDLDTFDDAPLIPAWMRSPEGWARWAGVFYRSRRRAARRWVRRQRTTNGHPAQFKRGTRRVHDWVVGLEGVQVQSLHHAAQIAARQARQANRSARFTPRVMPVKHQAAMKASIKSTSAAETAVNAYKKARKERSLRRNMRIGVAYGPPLAALGAGFATAGWAGLTGGLLATFAGGAFAGRHVIEEEQDWSADWRSFGDGDRMTNAMVDQVMRAAKVIGSEENVRMIAFPTTDTLGGTIAVFDLPPGIPAKKALNSVDAIASALGVETAQVTVTKKGRSGRIELYVTPELPFTKPAGRGPLLGLDGPTNFWGPISIGPDVRGHHVAMSVVERSGLIGGEPGAGKSASGNVILLAAALDPRVIMLGGDGKGGGDMEPFAPMFEEFDGMAEPRALDTILDRVIDIMLDRYALLKKLGKRKVTEELADQYPELRQMLLWIDELMAYTTDEEYGKKITRKLRSIVSRGRAAGIITVCTTQKPGSDVVDTSLRDLLSIRWALRCTTPEASDTILGRGAAASGYSAKTIESEMRGAGYLWSEGENPVMVRADYYTDEQVTELTQLAYGLRAKAGTLPESATPVADRLRAAGEDEGQILATLLDAFDSNATEDGPAEWLPASLLIDTLTSSGVEVTPEQLGALVVRPADENKKRAWNGARVYGYLRSRVESTVTERYGFEF